MASRTTRFTFAVLIFVAVASTAMADDLPTCPLVKLDNTQTTVCVDHGSDQSQATWTFHRCNKDTVCEIDDLEHLEVTNCVNYPTDLQKKYAGIPCKANTECFSNICNVVCQAIAAGATCADSTQCDYGYACVGGVCAVQKTQGACNSTYECANTHACVNGFCTEYFSQEDGTKIGSPEYLDSGLSVCKSGYSLGGVCKRLTPTNTAECKSSDCTYTDEAKATITIPDSCDCTFSGNAERRCQNPTGTPEAADFVNQTTFALKQLSKCNTEERTVRCASYYYNLTVSEYNTIQGWKKALWKRDNSHRIQGLNQDDIETAFEATFTRDPINFAQRNPDPEPPKNSTALATVQHSCPAFSCPKVNSSISNTTCAYVNQFPDVIPNQIGLYDQCDKKTQRCSWDKTKFDFITATAPVVYNCIALNTNNMRYAGEDCDANTVCYNGAKCGTDKKCPGVDAKGACTVHQDCLVGNACIGGFCAPQLKVNDKCTDRYQCANNLICNTAGVCADLFTVEEGKAAGSIEKNTKWDDLLCASGRNVKGVCVSFTYSDPTGVTDGFKECQIGTQCSYKVNGAVTPTDTYQMDCQCGYNPNGKAYCPVDDTNNVKRRDADVKATKSKFDNACHTINRENCYKVSSKLGDFNGAERQYRDAHLYYKAATCAEKVLSSSFVQISMGLLAALAVFLF